MRPALSIHSHADFPSAMAAENVPPRPISVPVICGLALPLDALAILWSSALAYALWLVDAPQVSWSEYGIISVLGTLLAINVFYLSGLYEFETITHPRLALRRLAAGWFGVASFLIALSFFTRSSEDYSRAWSMIWFIASFAHLALLRWALHRRIAKWVSQGRLYRNVAIVGSGPGAVRLLHKMTQAMDTRIRVAGVYDDKPGNRSRNALPASGDLNALVDRIQRESIDAVILTLPWSEEQRILAILERLRILPVDVHLCPEPVSLDCGKPRFTQIGGVPMLSVARRPLSDWNRAVKEIEDRVVAAGILLLISPLMLAIAALIKLDSRGPVLFRQKRYGYNNQLIEVFKFRTMYHDMRDVNAEQLTQRNDPRITRLGAYLRKWSLDELPQFLNVLRGDMSVVGPRPHAVSAKAAGALYQDAVQDYVSRHRVKPGITGWAQINGWRGETETLLQIRKRVEHDVAYIENWSVWLDVKIILLTAIKGFGGKNAF
ncbi:MAG: undecaprenyl-phosphate glucose phosphotransferase [Alphaproteobacteria bacterium]